MIVRYSSHARQRMLDRGISASEVEQALRLGSRQFQYPDKVVASHGYVSVVYKMQEGCLFVITVKMRW